LSEDTSKDELLVFVSHAGEDTWVAQRIADEITRRGARPFLDSANIPIAADFEEEILEFLDQADEMVALMTPWALDRPYIYLELGAAWQRRIPIAIVLYGVTAEEFASRARIPVSLKSRNVIQLNDIDRYFDELGARVDRTRDGNA
jgi:hypothetical protein